MYLTWLHIAVYLFSWWIQHSIRLVRIISLWMIKYIYVCMHHNRQWLLGDQYLSRQWRTHGARHWALCQFHGFTHGYSHKYNRGHVEARLVYLRPYWENEVKFVININTLKVSLSAAFSDVPELIVKHFVQFSTIPLVHIFHSSFPTGYFLVP